MDSVKYPLWAISGSCVSGRTDLNTALGKIVETNGCTILLCTGGYGIVSIDFRRMKISAGCLVILDGDLPFIPIGTSRDFQACHVSIRKEVSDEVFYKMTFSFWDMLYKYPILHTTPAQYMLLRQWFLQTDWLIHNCSAEQVTETVKNNIYNLFTAIECEMHRNGLDEANEHAQNRSWALYSAFYSLANRYHARHHDVMFYADKLNITPDYLHKLIHRIENISPKEILDRYIIVSIKVLLQATDLSIKNIATEIHFEGPPYMCRFFRRNTGMSPPHGVPQQYPKAVIGILRHRENPPSLM